MLCRICGQDTKRESYTCKACDRAYSKQRYTSNPKARASQLVSSMEFYRGKLPDGQRSIAVSMIVDAERCTYCGFPNDGRIPFGLDHRIPVALGGEHDISNLVPCCKVCNISKNAFAPEVYELWIANIKGLVNP